MTRPHLVDQDVPGPRRDVVGYGRHQPRVRWPNGAKVAVNIAVNNEEGSEYSKAAGDGRNEGLAEINYRMPPEYRDLCAESVYEYGGRAGIWRLMRLFDEYQIKTTFFTAAVALERNPEVAAWLGESGHEPCSHGWRWEEHWLLSREEEKERIQWAVESIKETCGERPLGWYCRYGPSVNTRELLAEEGGFIYDSDVYNDDLPYFTKVGTKQHLIVPYSLVYNDCRYVLAQGYSSPSDFFDTCRRGLDELWREGEAGYPKMMSVGLHPRWAGQAGRSNALREFIEYASNKGDVWFARRIDIARWWLDHHLEFGHDRVEADSMR
jgi:peptidoglycan/xylan/chitin deacetylase (PgdA/CDA1 family)